MLFASTLVNVDSLIVQYTVLHIIQGVLILNFVYFGQVRFHFTEI